MWGLAQGGVRSPCVIQKRTPSPDSRCPTSVAHSSCQREVEWSWSQPWWPRDGHPLNCWMTSGEARRYPWLLLCLSLIRISSENPLTMLKYCSPLSVNLIQPYPNPVHHISRANYSEIPFPFPMISFLSLGLARRRSRLWHRPCR